MTPSRIPSTLGDLKSIADRTQDHVERVNATLGPYATGHVSLPVIPGPVEPSPCPAPTVSTARATAPAAALVTGTRARTRNRRCSHTHSG